MPTTRGERFFFAVITVIITVHAYIFYSIFICNGDSFTEYASVFGERSVSTVPDALGVLGAYPCLNA